MKTAIVSLSTLAVIHACSAGFLQTVEGVAPAGVTVSCKEPGPWKFSVSKTATAGKDTGEIEIRLSAEKPSVPPEFHVECILPQRDTAYLWRAADSHVQMPVDWLGPMNSSLSSLMPLYAYFSESGQNRITLASSEVMRDLRFFGGMREEGSLLPLKFAFFTKKELPLSDYSVKVRFDWRDIRYEDAVRDASAWMTKSASLKPARVPECAFDPLYSSWYCFHMDVYAADIEKECAIAAKHGMKTVIVDDGWHTEDTSRAYRYCGDWQVSKRRFPDMAAHVKKIQSLGMKYMLWYSVPFVGEKAKNHARFKGKYLAHIENLGASVLDPRFPEVREFLIGTYEKALKDWNLDGFKLDFIDSFRGPGESQRGGGRDIDTVPEAVDRLMKDVYARLGAIKPDIMIEFRQSYVGPGIRQYGNMMRVADCPGNYWANRAGIARLRLTSGESAVHADMLEWNVSEKTQDAALYVVNCLFGVIQYSMMLRTLPPEHLRMIRAWLDFTQRHRNALLKGGFRAHMPHLGYPILEGFDDRERIYSVHAENMCVTPPADGRTVYIVNATSSDRVLVDFAAAALVEVRDTFGEKTETVKAEKGLKRINCPRSGYIAIRY